MLTQYINHSRDGSTVFFRLKVFLFLCLAFCSFTNYAANFVLESPAFQANSLIPEIYTCSGKNSPPPLVWSGVPANSHSLALVVNDPDSPNGTWTHWIVFNIPTNTTQLSPNVSLPEGAIQAKNSWGKNIYQGPCPSIGMHRYVFTLYALDITVDLEDSATTDTVLNAITGHVIGSAELVGLYQK
jgi:Raf kinase inhibitor-like YbhB/YbcL family protein